MSLHFEREMTKLQDRVLRLCGAVETIVSQTLKATEQQNEAAALAVIGDDALIDQMEVHIEEEGLKILALHQPVAKDLRKIMAVLKITNDLERIADYAVNIARRQLELQGRRMFPKAFEFSTMVYHVNRQLGRSVNALVQMDTELAWSVIRDDDQIDQMHRDTVLRTIEVLSRDPSQALVMMQVFSVSRSLERIGDHAVNIAEDVVYMITGEIVRHEHKTADRQRPPVKGQG